MGGRVVVVSPIEYETVEIEKTAKSRNEMPESELNEHARTVAEAVAARLPSSS